MRQQKKKLETKKKTPEKDPPPKSPLQGSFLFRAIIVVITSMVYFLSLTNGWTDWDDGDYVLKNEMAKTFDVGAILSSSLAGNYHPVTVFFLSVEYQLFGETASGYHAVSLFLHLINSLLVFSFVFLLLKDNIAGFIAGLLFGIHPLHVESVSWISAQKDLLYGMFYLLALVIYMKYADDQKKDAKKYWLVIILFLLSILSKAQAVTLPVVLIAIDWFRTKKISFRGQLDKIPFFIIALAFGIIAVFAQKDWDAIQDINYFSWSQRLLFASYAIADYMGKFLVPVNLSAYYPYPIQADGKYSSMVYAAPWIVLAAMLLVFSLRKKNSLLVFGNLFFLINIALVLQLLPVGGAITADRYSYISFTGWFLLIGALIAWSWKHRSSRSAIAIPVLLITTGWITFLVVKTHNRTMVWKNTETLFTDVISRHDNVYFAYNNLGWYYMNKNKMELAKKNFDKAIEIYPDYTNAFINRYTLLKKLGMDDSALVDARRLIVLRPDLTGPYLDRGFAYGMAGKTDSAIMDFRTALKLSPDSSNLYVNLGNIYFMKAMYDSSVSNYLQALRSDPSTTGAYNPLGFSYLELGDYEKALDAFNKAIAENPGDADNFYGRMQTYEKLQRYGDAYRDAEKAIQLGLVISDEYLLQLKNKAGS